MKWQFKNIFVDVYRHDQWKYRKVTTRYNGVHFYFCRIHLWVQIT